MDVFTFEELPGVTEPSITYRHKHVISPGRRETRAPTLWFLASAHDFSNTFLGNLYYDLQHAQNRKVPIQCNKLKHVKVLHLKHRYSCNIPPRVCWAYNTIVISGIWYAYVSCQPTLRGLAHHTIIYIFILINMIWSERVGINTLWTLTGNC